MNTTPNEHVVGNYAQVNGLSVYYEVYGTGEPLVLLHGGFGMTGMFGEVLTLLAASQKVIAVDLQAHGRTADIDRPLRYESMADDIAALITHLGLEQTNVMGYSLGGGVALRIAIQYPEVVKKLVLASTPFRHDGWYPDILAGMSQITDASAESMKETPMYQGYVSVAPRPQDFPVLAGKLGELLGRPYDWSTDVAALAIPIMIVYGDADSIPPTHAVQFFELLGGGKTDGGWDGAGMSNAQLAILPGTTHYTIFSSPALASTVTPFLESPMQGSSAFAIGSH